MFKVSEKVVVKNYNECLRLAKIKKAEDSESIYFDGSSIFRLDKKQIESIIGELTIIDIDDRKSCSQIRFRESDFWLYDFMIERKNKYVVKINI